MEIAHPVEVQRGRDRREVAVAYQTGLSVQERLKQARITTSQDGVAELSVVIGVVESRRDPVGSRVGCRQHQGVVVGNSDTGGTAVRQHFSYVRVGDEQMMGGCEGLTEHCQSGRVDAQGVAVCHVQQRISDRGPVPHSISDAVHDQLREITCSRGGIALQPAAGQHQVKRQVPVVDGGPGVDSDREQAIDQSVVEVQAAGIGCPPAGRLDSRPGNREPVCVDSQAGEQRHIIGVAVIVIDGDLTGASVYGSAWDGRDGVPDRRPATVDRGGALDAEGGRRDAEREIGGQVREITGVASVGVVRRSCVAGRSCCLRNDRQWPSPAGSGTLPDGNRRDPSAPSRLRFPIRPSLMSGIERARRRPPQGRCVGPASSMASPGMPGPCPTTSKVITRGGSQSDLREDVGRGSIVDAGGESDRRIDEQGGNRLLCPHRCRGEHLVDGRHLGA